MTGYQNCLNVNYTRIIQMRMRKWANQIKRAADKIKTNESEFRDTKKP